MRLPPALSRLPSRLGEAPLLRGLNRPPLVAGVAAAALTGALGLLLGSALQEYFVAALGMDAQRGALLSAMLLTLLATAAVAIATRRAGPARLGGIAGFCAIEIIPFLILAASTRPTPGLRAHPNVAGWILQPLGMLLLGSLSALAGGAVGVGLAGDARRFLRLLRRRFAWPFLAGGAALCVVAASAAVVALQSGPLGALEDYGVAVSPAPPHSPAPKEVTPPASPPAGTGATAAPAVNQLLALPGQIDGLVVSKRVVLVYVPGIYAADPSIHLPVVYFLHGTPGGPDSWLGSGGQLQGVLDQLIAARTVPPLIAVIPDGNGPGDADTEWGNTARYGDIESWLVDQVVPTIDARFRTLGATYRGIAGLSSGGFGAVNLALRHPGTFRWAASYSGYFIARSSVFGAATIANSPLDTAPRIPVSERMPLYVGIGQQDYEYRPTTTLFESRLRQLGWTPLMVQTVPGGHGWQAWRAELVNSLTWLGNLWGPQPWAAAGATP